MSFAVAKDMGTPKFVLIDCGGAPMHWCMYLSNHFPNVPLVTVTIAPSVGRFATKLNVPEIVLVPRVRLSKVTVPLVPVKGPAYPVVLWDVFVYRPWPPEGELASLRGSATPASVALG